MLTGGDVDASASAASLLQSIYGSQASQLTFSSASSAARVAARPKSSPVSALLAREAAIRQAQRSLSRPPSAVLRPSSAHPRGSTYAHAQRPTPSRPRTAIGSVRHRTSEEPASPALKPSLAPVTLTSVPEYFNFWNGKPLHSKEFGSKPVKRKAWRRPMSDYGSRLTTGRTQATETATSQQQLEECDSSANKSTAGNEGSSDTDRHGRPLDSTGANEKGRQGTGSKKQSGGGHKQHEGREGDEDTGTGRGSKHENHLMDKRNLGRSVFASRNQWADKKKTPPEPEDLADASEDFFKKGVRAASWLDSRLASSRCTRFELPMDLKQLEVMTPLQYLSRHCIVSERRMGHCSKVFTKADKDHDARISPQELVPAIQEAHFRCITAEQVQDTLEVVQLPKEAQVELRQFAAICCFAERMHGLSFTPMARRETIEVVDFEALEWKLRNCSICSSLWSLFARL